MRDVAGCTLRLERRGRGNRGGIAALGFRVGCGAVTGSDTASGRRRETGSHSTKFFAGKRRGLVRTPECPGEPPEKDNENHVHYAISEYCANEM
jgi:hypothetical protein